MPSKCSPQSKLKCKKQGKICNPSSGRCVNSKGLIGKKIKTKKRSRSISRSRCSSGVKSRCATLGKICNSKTGRCIISRGNSSKSILLFNKVSKRYGLNNIADILPKGYEFKQILGKGSYGEVYKICKDNAECKAIKINMLDSSVTETIREFKMQQKFAKYGLAPQVYEAGLFKKSNKDYGYIIMDLVDSTLATLIKNKLSVPELDIIINMITDMIKKLCLNNLIHGDLHWDNIAYQISAGDKNIIIELKLIPIDLGMACCLKNNNKCNPGLEILQLIRTLAYPYDQSIPKNNRTYLASKLIELYNNNKFGPKIENTNVFDNGKWYEIEDLHIDETDKNFKNIKNDM
jgi:tRNA A-37 threonylcarbamoyl transferase component Bud32